MIQIKGYNNEQSYKLINEAIKNKCLDVSKRKLKTLKKDRINIIEACICYGDGGVMCDSIEFDEALSILENEYREPLLQLYI